MKTEIVHVKNVDNVIKVVVSAGWLRDDGSEKGKLCGINLKWVYVWFQMHYVGENAVIWYGENLFRDRMAWTMEMTSFYKNFAWETQFYAK